MPKLFFVQTLPVPVRSSTASKFPLRRPAFRSRTLKLAPFRVQKPMVPFALPTFRLRVFSFDASSTKPSAPLLFAVFPCVARLYPYSYPVAGRTWLDSAGADRTICAQPEPVGPEPRIRYAVPIQPQYLVL